MASCRASLAGLRAKYREVFQEETRSRHREHLFRRIAWRLQALAEGDLSERARRRANAIAQDADLRRIAPRDFFTVGGERVETTPGDRSQSNATSAASSGYAVPLMTALALNRGCDRNVRRIVGGNRTYQSVSVEAQFWRAARRHFFNPAAQFSITVMGKAELSASRLSRKRWPSGATSYCCIQPEVTVVPDSV